MVDFKRMASQVGKRVLTSGGLRRDLRDAQGAVQRATKLSMTRVRVKRSLAEVKGHDLLINLGAGRLQDSRWINVDIEARDDAYFADLRDPLPLESGSVRHIHCEHFLEHLEYFYARKFLAECHRVLTPSGTMRIIVPDAEKYMRAYVSGDRGFFERLNDLGNPGESLRTPIEVINQMFRMSDSHKFAWDFETLELRAREAGFTRVERSELKSFTPELCIDGADWWREAESLYCNIYKQ